MPNPNYNAAEMLGALQLQNGAEIAEAFNADSPDDGVRIASKAAGIESTDPMDLLSKILGNQRKKYIKACKDLKYIGKIRKHLKSLPKAPGDKYPKDKIKELREDIQSIEIEYKSPPIKNVLDSCETKSDQIKKEVGPALDRAKSSLRESDCQVCGDALDDVDVVMTKCCNNVLCAPCGFHSTGIPNSKRLVGKCAKCRVPINIKSLIFIGKDFDVEKFVKNTTKIDKLEAISHTTKKDEESEESEIETCKTKKELIMRIIEGKGHPRVRIDVKVQGLLLGDEQLPEPKNKDRKFLIFSNHSEVLNNIQKELAKNKIGYLTLQGLPRQRFEQVEEHKNNKKIKVLLLNSMKACAGIDMPYVTDMIFCHEFLDKEIQGQASGRAQRMGRKHKMQYHYVLYDNEARHFKYTKYATPATPAGQNTGNTGNTGVTNA